MKIKVGQYIIPLFISLFLVLSGVYVNNLDRSDNAIPTSEAYLEDRSGSLTIEEILAKQNSGEFSTSKSDFLTFGSSRSAWWIELKGKFSKENHKDYILSVNNPSIQSITAYIPVEGKEGYVIKQSGWGYNTADRSVIASQTPVFEIQEQFDKESSIYLRIQSIYPHNYDVRILPENKFYNQRQQDLIFVGILLGTFITMALLNCMIFLLFRETAYLYYVFYQISMFFFQFVSIGASNYFMGPIAHIMMLNQSLFSCLMFITSLMFVKAFLNTRQNARKHHIALHILIGVLILNIILMNAGWRFESNIATDYLGSVTAALTLSVAIICTRKRINQANYFLVAWILLITGGIIFILRNLGIVPNNFLVQHIMLIAATGESLLIFAALIDRAKAVWKEKNHALLLYQEAENNRKKAEISFLRAQIKPHFLYNTLSVIATLTVKNPQRAKELLYDLADYLRGSFHFENRNGMTMLSEELNTIKAYLAIEKERFREKLTVEYEIDELPNLLIPLLSIQPLVENALRHGIFKRSDGGLIRIIVKRQSDEVMIQVQDNGFGIPEEKLTKILSHENGGARGVGLQNINERLIQLYGYGIEIESREDSGTTVTLRIPVEEGV